MKPVFAIQLLPWGMYGPIHATLRQRRCKNNELFLYLNQIELKIIALELEKDLFLTFF